METLSKNVLDAIAKTALSAMDGYMLPGAKINTSFLHKDGSLPAKANTGLIPLTGTPGGVIYATTDNSLLDRILANLSMPTGAGPRLDLIGEISNVLSGNLREEFGKEFHISTPFLISGPINRIEHAVIDRPYVMEVEQGGDTMWIVIAFDSGR
jgi:chemotaxis protein CheX